MSVKGLFKFDFGYTKIPFSNLEIGDDYSYIHGEGKMVKTSRGLAKVKQGFRGQEEGVVHQVSLKTEVLIKIDKNIFGAILSALWNKFFK